MFELEGNALLLNSVINTSLKIKSFYVLLNVDGNCKRYDASNLPRRNVMIDYLLFCRAGAQLVMSSCLWSLVKKTLQFRAITLHWVKVTVRSAATCCSVRPYPRLNQSHALPDLRSNLCTQDVL